MNDAIAFRAMTAEDQPFLKRLYASTRTEELAQTDWSEAEKASFLEFQFSAQHKFYTEQFTEAEFHIVLLEGEPIGRLYVDRREAEIRLIDIALLPEHRGKGIGSSLVRDLLAEGARISKPIRIHVEQFNSALRLYERLGFRRIADKGVYYLMEWTPTSSNADVPLEMSSPESEEEQ